MGKTGWDRFAVDSQDDGYYVEPLTLHQDNGVVAHEARRREREQVVKYLNEIASSETYREYGTREERMTIRWLAEDIREGRHYGPRASNPE